MKKKTVKRPNPFGCPEYPAFDFHIHSGTVQVYPIRSNVALYGTDFKKFDKWLDKVMEYAKQEPSYLNWWRKS